MQIVYKDVNELIPYEDNPRNNDEAVQYVKASINEFGFKNPIIIDSNNVVVAGHTRLKAAKELEYATVPCIVADDLTDEQIRAFRLADNKTSEFATWDLVSLELELEAININMGDFGFDFMDLRDNVDDDDERPIGFKEFGEDLETAHVCPRCGYEWN